MEIAGARVLVTGASSGIGSAIAANLSAHGARVWGTSRNPSVVAWQPGIVPLRLDLSDPDCVEEDWASQEMDDLGFDIVVNNAGSGVFGRFSSTRFEDWRAQISTLLLGTMKVTQLALPGLIERRGYLVNVSSLAAEFPVPFMCAYNASKAGLSGFSESIALETLSSGMKVIDLRPGDIKTAFSENMVIKRPENENEGCMNRVWSKIDGRISRSPRPEKVAEKLTKCIQKDKMGVIRVGTFFQSYLAPLARRILPGNLIRSGNLSYYLK